MTNEQSARSQSHKLTQFKTQEPKNEESDRHQGSEQKLKSELNQILQQQNQIVDQLRKGQVTQENQQWVQQRFS